MEHNIELPNFNHPEVSVFYEYDLSIPKEKVIPILELPRETLIEDLETMIMDSIQRDSFFRNYPDEDKWWEFHKHALWVLVEIEAVEALPTVLELLKQNDDFNWFWFGDFATEEFWEIIYHLGGNRLEELKEIVLNAGEWVNRIVTTTAVEQIGLHQPERRVEIIKWFQSILDSFLDMSDENPALDGEVVSSIIGDLISLHAKELLPQIKLLAERDLVFEGFVGDLKSIEKDIQDKNHPSSKRKIFPSIFDRYKSGMNYHGYRMKYDENYKKINTPKPAKSYEPTFLSTPKVETIKREGKKIGRNDPCSCGSGRKYKKCCLKK